MDMALSTTVQATPLATTLVVQTVTNATPNNNVTGAAGVLYLVDIDNTANAAATFLKIYDAASPTVGTTAATYVIRVAATTRRSIAIVEGFEFTALSFAAVTTAAEAGVTSPSSPVVVRMLCG